MAEGDLNLICKLEYFFNSFKTKRGKCWEKIIKWFCSFLKFDKQKSKLINKKIPVIYLRMRDI